LPIFWFRTVTQALCSQKFANGRPAARDGSGGQAGHLHRLGLEIRIRVARTPELGHDQQRRHQLQARGDPPPGRLPEREAAAGQQHGDEIEHEPRPRAAFVHEIFSSQVRNGMIL
jgi:hypothetical protein